MTRDVPTGPDPTAPSEAPDRLDSWKDVAAYLKRDVSTVQRWERREGLPIHRLQHDKQGSVFAFRSELEAGRDARTRRGEPPLAAAEADAEAPVAEPTAAPTAIPVPQAPPRRAGRRLAAGAAAAGLTMAGLFAWWLVRPAGIAQTAVPAIRSIVVLPFENLSGDPTQDVVVAGLTEEVTSRLAQLRGVRVVSRTSAMSLAGRQLSVGVIAKELDVDAVIEGSLRQERGRVRIAVQLIHAPSDTHVWARDFDRVGVADLDLQIDVAGTIAREFAATAVPDESALVTSAPRGDPAAHQEYLLGRHLLWKLIEDDRVLAIGHFERAIALDPTYAAPYAALAHAWWMRGAFGSLSLKQVESPAREAALAALARDDRNAEAHAALAYVQGMFDWDWPAALRTIQTAIRLEPNRVDARYVHGLLLMAMGRLPGAISEMDVAATLDPLSAQVHSTYGRVLHRAGRLDEAERHLRRALELEPRSERTYTRLAQVLAQKGDIERALALLDDAETVAGSRPEAVVVARARTMALAGRPDEARRLMKDVTDSALRAEVLATLGDRDAAFAAVLAALDGRDSWLLFIKSDPIFEDLRSDPRWATVLERMNLRD